MNMVNKNTKLQTLKTVNSFTVDNYYDLFQTLKKGHSISYIFQAYEKYSLMDDYQETEEVRIDIIFNNGIYYFSMNPIKKDSCIEIIKDMIFLDLNNLYDFTIYVMSEYWYVSWPSLKKKIVFPVIVEEKEDGEEEKNLPDNNFIDKINDDLHILDLENMEKSHIISAVFLNNKNENNEEWRYYKFTYIEESTWNKFNLILNVWSQNLSVEIFSKDDKIYSFQYKVRTIESLEMLLTSFDFSYIFTY